MRRDTICISERDLMFVIAGQLFDQAPNRSPRKAEIIMDKVRDSFREVAYNNNEYYTVRIEEENLYQWIHSMLFNIPEFKELNLSQIEYENGVSVDDESRPKFAFTSRYDVYVSESWKIDFIDLDAFVQNVHNRLFNILDSQGDCFGCEHQPKDEKSTLACGDSEKCRICCINPNLRNNYEGLRYTRGKYTFACKYDCYKNRYICCEECDDKENCDHRCDSKSDDCGNALNHKGV